MTGLFCRIKNCEKGVAVRGLCHAHYKRLLRYGDPLLGGRERAGKGAALTWLLEHVGHQGDACLAWPFATSPNGYGVIRIDGVKQYAHRIMCEKANGSPENPDLLACHKCGKGHEACVNPSHLKWGSAVENSADKIKHDTAYRGERCVIAKLTEADVRKIRDLKGVLETRELADAYDVSMRTVRDVINRRTWAWLE